jgi:hypothetical protein
MDIPSRAVGRSQKLVRTILYGGQNLLFQVEIGFANLQKMLRTSHHVFIRSGGPASCRARLVGLPVIPSLQ